MKNWSLKTKFIKLKKNSLVFLRSKFGWFDHEFGNVKLLFQYYRSRM